jgi:hypothetical protein
MVNDLFIQVQAAVFGEYCRAAEKFGKTNNSPHESFAILFEEFQEAQEQSEMFGRLFDKYWQSVRKNVPTEEQNMILSNLKEIAERATAEWVQVAAMCYKATVKEDPTDAN